MKIISISILAKCASSHFQFRSDATFIASFAVEWLSNENFESVQSTKRKSLIVLFGYMLLVYSETLEI